MAELLVVVGSVTPPGRLLKAAQWVAQTAEAEGGNPSEVVNLADFKVSFADGRPPEQYQDDTGALVKRVHEARSVILASPVYRASFTGSLKNLLDQLPIETLMGKPCSVITMGATTHHYLGADWHLRDVLTWFGALLPPTSVYLSSADFNQGELSEGARDELRALVRAVLKMRGLTPAPGEFLGPPPLAARYR